MASMKSALREWLRDMLVNGLGASRVVPRHARWIFLRSLGYEVSRAVIAPGCYIGGRKLTIGKGSFLNSGVFLDTSGPIRIGSNVAIAMDAMILTGSHQIGESRKRAGDVTRSPVTIGDGAWIGARVVIMPGVRIGPGAVIAAGSLVTSDCLADTIYSGSPARPSTRKMDDE